MTSQILAVVIFLVMFALIIIDKWEKHLVTLCCGLLTLVLVFGISMHDIDAALSTLNVRAIFTQSMWFSGGEGGEASSGINWETIIFLAGMMVMVEGMDHAGFFRWLCLRIAKMVKYQVIPIFITFMVLSFGLAMFIDSITVILFLSAVTLELARLLEFNPVPVILSEIFCANLGGSATMCGDPPNIIIGTSLGYSFTDFFANTGLTAFICLIVVVIYFYFVFRKQILGTSDGKQVKAAGNYPDPSDAIHDKTSFLISSLIFLLAVIMLVTHAQTGLTVAFIGVVIAAITLITSWKVAPELLKKVDYKILLFFIGLFIVVGGLEQTQVLEVIAGLIEKLCGDNHKLMIVVIIWISAIASAFVDNIPFSATMIPIIHSISDATGFPLSTLAWTLAIGTDIGGSATPIGASANVVGMEAAKKDGYKVTWGHYLKSMAPVTVLVIALSMVLIFIRYHV